MGSLLISLLRRPMILVANSYHGRVGKMGPEAKPLENIWDRAFFILGKCLL